MTESTLRRYSPVNDMIDWESGSLDEDGEIRLFRYLIATGIAWSLQGMYGRRAEALIESGAIEMIEVE